MVNHKPGTNYSFAQLLHAYNAEPQTETDAPLVLAKGDDILALCLRAKHSPKPGEVLIPADPGIAEWGAKLAALKDQKSVPIYIRPRGRTLYECKGPHIITGDTDDPQELAKAKSPVPLSRIIYVTAVESGSAFKEAQPQSAFRNR